MTVEIVEAPAVHEALILPGHRIATTGRDRVLHQLVHFIAAFARQREEGLGLPRGVISSLDNGAMGSSMLELVFHEASHQWDGPLLDQLAEIGHTMDKRVPTGLTHAMIWLTSGEAVRRVIPGHTPIARIGRHLAARRQSSIPAVGRGGLAPISQRPRNCDEALVALMKRVS